jgi:multidrug efflux pump subunit AcrA (membrane-fusion protein)
LSVDGTITLEKLDNVLYVGRPAFGQEKQTVGMFKIDPDEKGATRVPVELGRSSVNTIEVLRGLKEGDKVILSDMSRWDNVDRIRLER